MPIPLTILGAGGKMGQRLLRLAGQDPRFQVVGGCVRELRDLGIPLETCALRAMQPCAVAIDFTHASATRRHLEAAVQLGKPLVLGTTGHSTEDLEEIGRAAQKIPLLFAPNFTVGIALCLEAVARFGRALAGQCQVEIVETHHVHKKDSPSGTALALAREAGGEATIRSVRTEEVVGEHTVIFTWGEERMELKHQVHARDAFALGALRGAEFLIGKPAGLYSVKDLY